MQKTILAYVLDLMRLAIRHFFGRAQRVMYSSKYPILDPTTQTKEERTRRLLYTKSDQWAYEKEWRIFDPCARPGVQVFPPELLTSVTFGMRISPDDEALVRGWIDTRAQRPSLWRAVAKQREFGLDFVPA